MKKLLLILILISIVLCFPKHFKAQWIQTKGPEGGPVLCIAADDSFLYVTTYDAIFRSSDNGETWVPTMGKAYTLTIINSTLVAGTHGGGVYRSTDNGDTWTSWESGLPGRSVIFDFVVNGMNLFAATANGVYLSLDNGANWIPRNTGLTTTSVLSLTFKDEFLFAGTGGEGIFRSDDNGLTWDSVNNGLTSDVVWSFAVIDTILFAGTWRGDGVYRSLDNGMNWVAENYGVFNPDVNALIVYNNNLFAGTHGGVFCSLDHAKYWFRSSTGLESIVNCFHLNGSNLYAGAENGIYLAAENGDDWSAKNSGLRNAIVYDLAISGPNLLAATSGSGIYLSDDEGSTWNKTNVEGGIFSLTTSVNNIFAGSYGMVYKSANNGEKWDRFFISEDGAVYCIAVIDTNIFAGTDGDGVFLSTDGAENWKAINTGLSDSVVYSFAVNGTILFAATQNAVFYTVDSGENWIPINSGLKGTPVQDLTFCENYLFAGTNSGGVFRLNNDNNSWEEVNNGLKEELEVRSFTTSDTSLFAGTSRGIFLSEDFGESWIQVDSALWVESLEVSDGNLFAGTRGSSIWKRPLSEMISSIDENSHKFPSAFHLNQNYPNPFNPSTKIKFALPKPEAVKIEVYNIIGQKIQTLLNKPMPAGYHEVEFNGQNLSSGIYLYRIEAGDWQDVKKMIYLK
jgi:photosystem II stability/assembly factor-like uncharacterized protein